MKQDISAAASAAKQVTDMFGKEIIADRKRFCAALSDLAPKLSKENKAFYVALSEDIGKLYLREDSAVSSGTKQPENVINAALASIGEYLNEEKAAMVAYSLAYAIGWNVDISGGNSAAEASSGSVIEDLFRRAENGDNDACFNLGECFYYGRGVKQDYKRAVEWYTRSAERGDCSSQKKLAACWHSGIGTEPDLGKAAHWYREAAEQGDFESQKSLVMCFRIGGKNLEANPERAARYAERYGIETSEDSTLEKLLRDAESGSPAAQFAVGNAFYNGTGTPADREKAVMWYKRASDQNYPPGMFNYACCLSTGTGIAADPEKAAELYKRASSAGDLDSLNNLALCYFNGSGVPQNKRFAAELWKKAAKNGHPRGQYNFAECKFNGWGVERNFTEAAMWYRKAAAQSDPDAQYSLGWCSEHGQGITKDSSVAKQMYELSAQQGNTHAQKALGYMYMNGSGTEKNCQKASDWFSKAAVRGDSEAAVMLVRCHKYGGQYLIPSEPIARGIAQKYGVDYDNV